MEATRLLMAALVVFGACPCGAWASWQGCVDDPDADLCYESGNATTGATTGEDVTSGVRSQTGSPIAFLLAALLGGGAKSVVLFLPLALTPLTAEAAGTTAAFSANTCASMKNMYKQASCCGHPDQSSHFLVVPLPEKKLANTNICANAKPVDSAPGNGDGYFNNVNCTLANGVMDALEQAGANVTMGYKGEIDAMAANRLPITTSYLEAGLCPVNVHWHLGTEHLSVGEFDEQGSGPAVSDVSDNSGAGDSRRLATNARLGFRCHKYNANDPKFTTEYSWQHCKSMHVGETYEVHWPHSAAGACGTPYQYQTPFYDGVFCKGGIVSLDPLNTFMKIGVQSQVFTIVNDENYYYPDLMRGMIIDGDYGKDVGKYTGSTTGTSRSNTVCSRFTPITWQVDRKCHLISASSFDKMCADMKTQSDDMSDDLHAHGSRELVLDKFAANNLHRRLVGAD